jgi:tetratricopeptide (TPR) repeat protein
VESPLSTVFLSYYHEHEAHQARVRELAEAIQALPGVRVVLDQFEDEHRIGDWYRWSCDELRHVMAAPGDRPPGKADRVLVILSPGWIHHLTNREAEDSRGLGIVAEAKICESIWLRAKQNTSVSPLRILSFGEADHHLIPSGWEGVPRFRHPEDFPKLSAWLGLKLGALGPLVPWPTSPPSLDPWDVPGGDPVRERFARLLVAEAKERLLRVVWPGGDDPALDLAGTLSRCLQRLASGQGGPSSSPPIRVGRIDLKGGLGLDEQVDDLLRQVLRGTYDAFVESFPGAEPHLLLRRLLSRIRREGRPTLLVVENFGQGGSCERTLQKNGIEMIPEAESECLRLITTSARELPAGGGEEPWERLAGDFVRLPAGMTPRPDGSARKGTGDPDAGWAGLPEPDPSGLREAFLAAAVPHWCDPGFLAALLGEAGDSGPTGRFEALRGLPGIEAFPARGEHAVNVSAGVRASLRRRLVEENPDLLRLLSARAAAHLADDSSRTGRMERIYHRLVAEGDAAADDAEALDGEFWQGFGAADHGVYARMLLELAEEGSLHGRALLEALVSGGFSAAKTGDLEGARRWAARAREAAGSGAAAQEDPAQAALYRWGEARAHCIEAEVHEELGQDAAARQAYGQYLALMEAVTAVLPDRVRLRREQAVAESRCGNQCDVPSEALRHYRRSRELQAGVVAAKPGDPGERRELAMMDSLEGNARFRLNQTAEALALFQRFVAGCRERAASAPENLVWLGDLADGLRQLGDALQRSGRSAEALVAFRESLSWARHRADLDPVPCGEEGKARPQDAATLVRTAQGRVIHLLLQFGEFRVAREEGTRLLEESRRAAERSPENPNLRFQLAAAYTHLGEISRCQGALSPASGWYEEALRIHGHLLAQAPRRLWRQELAAVLGLAGFCRAGQGKTDEAEADFVRQVAEAETLLAEFPDDVSCRSLAITAHLSLAELSSRRSDWAGTRAQVARALELARALAAEEPNADAETLLARALLWDSDVKLQENEPILALGAAQRAIHILERQANQVPDDLGKLTELAAAHLRLAAHLELRGDPASDSAANEHRQQAADCYERQAAALQRECLADWATVGVIEQLVVLHARDGTPEKTDRAIALLQELIPKTSELLGRPEHRDLEAPRQTLARFHGYLGELLVRRSDLPAAGEAYGKALAGWEALQREQPARAEWLHHAAEIHLKLADLAALGMDRAATLSAFSRAIEGLERSWKIAPTHPVWRRNLVAARYRRARLHAEIGHPAAALEDLEKCREHLEYVESLPDQGRQISRDMFDLEYLTGDVLSALGRYPEAIEAYSRALDRAGKHSAASGHQESDRRLVSSMEFRLGSACRLAGRFGEAGVFLRKRFDFCEDELQRSPGNPLWRREQARVLMERGMIHGQLGELGEGLALYREAIDHLEAAVSSPEGPSQHAWRSDLATALNDSAILLQRLGLLPEAIRQEERAIAIAEGLSIADPNNAIHRNGLAVYRKNLDIFRAAP